MKSRGGATFSEKSSKPGIRARRLASRGRACFVDCDQKTGRQLRQIDGLGQFVRELGAPGALRRRLQQILEAVEEDDEVGVQPPAQVFQDLAEPHRRGELLGRRGRPSPDEARLAAPASGVSVQSSKYTTSSRRRFVARVDERPRRSGNGTTTPDEREAAGTSLSLVRRLRRGISPSLSRAVLSEPVRSRVAADDKERRPQQLDEQPRLLVSHGAWAGGNEA